MNPRHAISFLFKATLKVAFFFVLLAQFVTWQASSALADAWHVRVKAVFDGDTFVVEGGERIRLRGIDAPEIRHGDEPGQYYGQTARKVLDGLILGKTVVLDRSEMDTDRYGRKVAVVRLTDGRLVNAVMVEEGAAFVYPHSSDRDANFADQLLSEQLQAMRQQRGFWPKLLALPAARDRYVGTTSSRRFHTLTCSNGASITPKNRTDFSSLAEAFRAGFAPARECTVWPREE